jgi:predicted trehalose synthase
VWFTIVPVLVDPSPQSHVTALKWELPPKTLAEAVSLKGASPSVELTATVIPRAKAPDTVTVVPFLAVEPEESVTVTVMLYVPPEMEAWAEIVRGAVPPETFVVTYTARGLVTPPVTLT